MPKRKLCELIDMYSRLIMEHFKVVQLTRGSGNSSLPYAFHKKTKTSLNETDTKVTESK